MTNLAVQYYNRHGGNHIIPSCAGVCFFCGGSDIVVLTSSMPRAYTRCSRCHDSHLTIELFAPGIGLGVLRHDHIENPDTDIAEYIKSCGFNLKPVQFTNTVETEHWLWNVFIKKFKGTSLWTTLINEKDDKIKTTEEMALCSIGNSRLYKLYYESYKVLLAGRTYLYLKDKWLP